MVFGGALNLGSIVKKTKEYVGEGVKFWSVASKLMVTKLLSFKKTKTGLGLITVFQEAIVQFNDVICKCKCLLGSLFPVNECLTRFLQLKRMESALIS